MHGAACAAPTHPPLLHQSPILFCSVKCPDGCAWCRPTSGACVACEEGKGLVSGVCIPCASSNAGCGACPNDITKVRCSSGCNICPMPAPRPGIAALHKAWLCMHSRRFACGILWDLTPRRGALRREASSPHPADPCCLQCVRCVKAKPTDKVFYVLDSGKCKPFPLQG